MLVLALISFSNSNLFYRNKVKRKLRISVLLFSVPMILKSMEIFVCLLLLLWFIIETVQM